MHLDLRASAAANIIAFRAREKKEMFQEVNLEDLHAYDNEQQKMVSCYFDIRQENFVKLYLINKTRLRMLKDTKL